MGIDNAEGGVVEHEPHCHTALVALGRAVPEAVREGGREQMDVVQTAEQNRTVPFLAWIHGSNEGAVVTYHLPHDSCAHGLRHDLSDIAQLILLSKYEQHHPN